MDSVEIAGAADERRGSGEGPGWEPDVGDIEDLLGSMQLEPRSLAPGVLLVDGDASGGDVDTGRAKGASLEIAAVDLHAHQLGATGADAVTARRVGSFKQRAGDGGVGETDVNASGGSGRQTKAHLAVVGDGGGISDSSLGGPLPEVHHGGTAESLLVPCSVRIFLEEYYEASQSSRGIYRQAAVASRALCSVREETCAEPLEGNDARPSTKRARARRRADAECRGSFPSSSAASLRLHQRSAARIVTQKEKASKRRFVELFQEQFGVIVGRFARNSRVYDGTCAAARPVMGGKAIVVQDLNHSCVVWAAVVMDKAHFYCSCHGRREA